MGEPAVRRAWDARLRLDLGDVRGSVDRVRGVEETLRGIAGVREVRVDVVTGGVAILYDPAPRMEPPAAVPAFLPVRHATPHPPAPLLARLVEAAIVVVVEVALQRVLGPFFGLRRC